MRVIGGSARGRRLRAPDIGSLRPTGDRVREAIFDILSSRGLPAGARVLDLFAGSGALGIEALSRGASAVCFVDRDRRALQAVRANLEATGFGPSPAVRIVCGEAVEVLAREPQVRYDLALVDPPYSYDAWATLLGLLRAEVAVLESAQPVALPEGFGNRREYRYGGTLVTLVEAHPPKSDIASSADEEHL